MANSTTDIIRKFQEPSRYKNWPIASGETLVKGGQVVLNASGYLENGSDTASYIAGGIVMSLSSNTAPTADGGEYAVVDTETEYEVTCNDTLTQASVGSLVACADNSNVTTTVNNIAFAKITRYISANKAIVSCKGICNMPLRTS